MEHIVDSIRQATKALSEHPDDPGAQRTLEAAIDNAERASDMLSMRLQQMKPLQEVNQMSLQEVNQIIDFNERFLSVVPASHETRMTFLTNLSIALNRRFKMMEPNGNPKDMDRAVDLAEEAVSVTRVGTVHRISALGNLNTILQEQYSQTRDVEYIQRAITAAEKALEVIPVGAPYKAVFLNKLAVSLCKLFENQHDLDVANRAVGTAEFAVKTAQKAQNIIQEAINSNTLARILARRIEETGVITDLERAISILIKAVPRIPTDTKDHVAGLSCLATLLAVRFEQQGDVTDLNKSIQHMETVLQFMSDRDPNRPVQLFNKANRLSERGQYNKSISDLSDAIDYAQQALSLGGENHPERANWLRGLGELFGIRFTLELKKRSQNPDDLRQAIKFSRQAAEVVDRKDIPTRASLANVLSNLLTRQYEQDRNVANLDEAIDVLRATLQAILLTTSPERAVLEHGLGNTLEKRFLHTRNSTDLEESRKAFQRAWDCLNSPVMIRIDAATRAAGIAATQAEYLKNQDPSDSSELLHYWTEASMDLDQAISLLPALSPRHMQNVNKQHMLTRFPGLGAHAAAAALNAKKPVSYALQQLELGRAIIFSLTLDLRTDLSSLREKHPDMADQLSRLRDMWESGDSTLPSTGSWGSSGQARRQVQKAFEDLLTRIRLEKGFERFLMPPTVEQLMEAADPDPAVVVNVSLFRCDAFIVEKQGIRLLELSLLKLKDIQTNIKGLKDRPDSLPSVLEWLWRSTVHPILDALGFSRPLALDDDSWPHIWWIPVGPLSSLPLHAAGYHTKKSGETALDRVMSSYSLSLKSLLAGRLQKMPQYDPSPINCLLVSMNTTPYHSALPYAEREVGMLEELCPALKATPIRPPQKKADILAQLSRCDIFHFAGHGASDLSDPSRSALLLSDWEKSRLTVEDLRNQKLQEPEPPFLAYLSACSTGANEVLELVDEGIHLGYACQLAGFRHVVATLWSVSDRSCVDVARKFYETIRDKGKTDVAVHRGLHLALRELRDVRVQGKNHRGSEMVVSEKNDGTGDDETQSDKGDDDGSRKGVGVGVEPALSMNSLWVPFVHFGV